MENRLIQPGKFLTKNDLKQVAAIIEQATADNTRRAYRKDLAYLGSWAAAPCKYSRAIRWPWMSS